jgi:hypothetical protein
MLFEVNAPEVRATMNREERDRVHDDFAAASQSWIVHHALFFFQLPIFSNLWSPRASEKACNTLETKESQNHNKEHN